MLILITSALQMRMDKETYYELNLSFFSFSFAYVSSIEILNLSAF